MRDALTGASADLIDRSTTSTEFAPSEPAAAADLDVLSMGATVGASSASTETTDTIYKADYFNSTASSASAGTTAHTTEASASINLCTQALPGALQASTVNAEGATATDTTASPRATAHTGLFSEAPAVLDTTAGAPAATTGTTARTRSSSGATAAAQAQERTAKEQTAHRRHADNAAFRNRVSQHTPLAQMALVQQLLLSKLNGHSDLQQRASEPARGSAPHRSQCGREAALQQLRPNLEWRPSVADGSH
jgi:hypothetical protein